MNTFFKKLVFGLCAICLPLTTSLADQNELTFDHQKIHNVNTPTSAVRSFEANEVRHQDLVTVWANDGMITHPGAGFDGADISMASEDRDFGGVNVRLFSPANYFRIATFFYIPETSILKRIVTFGYETSSAPPTWEGGNLRIWDGPPSDPASSILFHNDNNATDITFSGIYRVLHQADLQDTSRPIYEITWDLTTGVNNEPLTLKEGWYWVDWQLTGGITAWSAIVMEENIEDPDNPTTVPGDGLHLRPDGWEPLQVAIPLRLLSPRDALFTDRFEAPDGNR